MTYEKQLNITTAQLITLEKQGVLVGKLAYAGFKFDPTSPKSLDKQLDDFCDAQDSDEHDDVTYAAETSGSSCDELEEIHYERLEVNMVEL